MIGLNDVDVIGLVRAVARLQNQLAEAEQELFNAIQAGRWLYAEQELLYGREVASVARLHP